MQHKMIISNKLNASILFFPFHNLLVKFLFHSIKYDGSIVLLVFLCLVNEIANLRLNTTQAVIKPRLHEMYKLLLIHFRTFDDILFFKQIFIKNSTHIHNANNLHPIFHFIFSQNLLDLFFLIRLIYHTDSKLDFVDNLKLRPVIIEYLWEEIQLLCDILTML